MEYGVTTVNTANLHGTNNDTMALMLADWHKTKAHVYPCLLSRDTYQSIPNHLAHDDLFDFVICYYFRTFSKDITNILWIPEKSLDMSRITKDALKAQAMENLRHDGYKIHDMGSVLSSFMDSPPGDGTYALPMFVLTNQKTFLGAAGIMLDGLLTKFAGTIKNSFYILPSSIHETILVPAYDVPDTDGLNRIIREVNATQVHPLEQLSDHAYYYNAKTHKIQIAA